MTITVTIGSTDYPGTETPPGPSGNTCVVVPTLCPRCGERHSIVDRDGVTRALALEESIPTALREMQAKFGPCAVLLPPYVADGCRVRLVESTELHDGWDGKAECIRCRTVVGTMSVRVSTLFGVEEDTAVLNGRARVY